jgi:DNA-directed RNA polymerase subunit RPC12/RpoP
MYNYIVSTHKIFLIVLINFIVFRYKMCYYIVRRDVMSKNQQRVVIEQKERVSDVSTMVMWHPLPNGTKEQRCPYCFSRKMRILDYDLAEGVEARYGKYKFIKKCLKCGGRFKVLKKEV